VTEIRIGLHDRIINVILLRQHKSAAPPLPSICGRRRR